MAADVASDLLWSRLSELIARKTGLHFPVERYSDLRRGLVGASAEFGFADVDAFVDWLLSARLSRIQLHTLAGHLTVGETYFFRDKNTFAALSGHVLPQLIERRRNERRLRLWSAACCTGEEAYSLAILLQQCLPDWRDWRITLLATDISERFLEKARAAAYGDWSFRDAPSGFKSRYFTANAEGRYTPLPQIRQMVRFEQMNLVEDSVATLVPEANAMDLILCRNVLMYFTSSQQTHVVDSLYRTLSEESWLIVAASEGSRSLLPRFTPVTFPGAIFYRKGGEQAADTLAYDSLLVEATRFTAPPSPPPLPAPSVAPSVASPEPVVAKAIIDEPDALSLEARALADQGRLAPALELCDRWIAADPLDSAGRYLRAVILEELGEREQSRRALMHAVYLQADFVLAHFALGNLARGDGKAEESRKHLQNALALLGSCAPDDVLPHSDGLTAGRLKEILTSLLAQPTAS
jgi:chemotaxis protein methyltransferase CheR